MEVQVSDWRAALWPSPQGVSFQLSLSPEEMPRVGVRAGAGLNPEGWTWMGGTLPGQPGKGRGEWPPWAAGLGTRRAEDRPAQGLWPTLFDSHLIKKRSLLSSNFHSHHAIYCPNLDASENEIVTPGKYD